MTKQINYLSDPMPMDNNTLGAELVGELDRDGVANLSTYGRPWKLPIDAHHDAFDTVRRPELVLHFPSEVPDFRSTSDRPN